MIAAGVICAFSQIPTTTTPKSEPPPKPTVKTTPTPDAKGAAPKQITPETVVETALIFAYAYPGGRATLNQIRKTTLERGKATFTSAEGKSSSTYQRYIIRGETVGKEKIRLDQDFPNAKYSLVYEEDKIYGIFNNSVFAPREDAAKSFENQIVHGIEPLLRYKEDGSTLEMGAREKIEGVDFYVIDLTDKKERKTRYYVSAKSFRVMMLTYEDGGVKYKRKFYDYNIAQGTLVPYQTVLWADDKKVEETEIGTITFGQKVDEELFKAG
jgi:hypothetical protein